MSTRCQVRIIKNGYPLNLYHHYDGYFKNGVGEQLHNALKPYREMPANTDFEREVRDDRALESVMKLVREDKSYEPTFWRHGDIEYFYLLNFDKGEFMGWQTPVCKAWDDLSDEDGKWYGQLPNLKDGHYVINLLDEIKEEYDN